MAAIPVRSRAIERQRVSEAIHFTMLDTDIDNLEAGQQLGFAQIGERLDEHKATVQWLVRGAFGLCVSLLTTSVLLYVNLVHH